MIQELDRLSNTSSHPEKDNSLDAHLCVVRLNILARKMAEYYLIPHPEKDNSLDAELLPIVHIKGKSYMYTEDGSGSIKWYSWDVNNHAVAIDYDPLGDIHY